MTLPYPVRSNQYFLLKMRVDANRLAIACNSLLASTVRLSFDMVFSTLPAAQHRCVSLSRASFAEPPASRLRPGKARFSKRLPKRNRRACRQRGDAGGFLALDFLPLESRASACSMASSTILPPSSGCSPSQSRRRRARTSRAACGVPRGEFLLRLAVELRAHDARREREAGALPQVVRDQLHALRREAARLHERGQGLEDSRAEAASCVPRARRIRLTWLSAKVSPSATQPMASSLFSRLDLGDIGILEEALPVNRERSIRVPAARSRSTAPCPGRISKFWCLYFQWSILLLARAADRLRTHQVLQLRERMLGESKYFGSGTGAPRCRCASP